MPNPEQSSVEHQKTPSKPRIYARRTVASLTAAGLIGTGAAALDGAQSGSPDREKGARPAETATRSALAEDFKPGSPVVWLEGGWQIDPTKIKLRPEPVYGGQIDKAPPLPGTSTIRSLDVAVIQRASDYVDIMVFEPNGVIAFGQVNGGGDSPSIEGIRKLDDQGNPLPAAQTFAEFDLQAHEVTGTVSESSFAGRATTLTAAGPDGKPHPLSSPLS